jgi:hypothetical protein
MSLSRRSLVTSAAALPALALPAVAIAAEPSTNPTLLALAEQLKPVWARLQSIEPERHRTYEEAKAGLPQGWALDKEGHYRTWRERGTTNGYFELSKATNNLQEQIYQLTDAIREIPSTNRMEDAIRLAAILMRYDDQDCCYQDELWEIAAPAGFALPWEYEQYEA